MKTNFTSLFLLFFVLISCSKNNQIPMQNDNFDINKYLGKWYEIARFPHSFEKDLIGVTANYSLKDDGKIKVENKGYVGSLDGPKKNAIGKAKFTKNPRRLKVSFFWIFYGKYDILEVDLENYKYALVGSGKNFLWILSRTPQMDEKTYEMLVEKAKSLGYDVNDLMKVEQRMDNN
jgi:apolipoprotein D and lipocalin family protein